MNHLLKLLDCSSDEITGLLDLADKLKKMQKNGDEHAYLAGKSLGMIFQKASTRTRVSFETGIFQLGGHGLFLSPRDIQMGRGESIEDTARVLSRYLDIIMIRTFAQSDVQTLAQYSSVPVINALTDDYHPCQVLADLMTIREKKGALQGLKLCYIGDGNNMANSLIVGGLKTGMSVSVACPAQHLPHKDVISFAKTNGDFYLSDDIIKCAKNADVLVTDVWSSMGMEDEIAIRAATFKNYQINDDILQIANSDAIVLHCLPAHRGEEITASVFEKHANTIFDEAENRLHAQKAVMVELLHK